MNTSEKRKYPRRKLPLKIKYYILNPNKNTSFLDKFLQKFQTVKTSDISGSGALLIVKKLLDIGAKLHLEIYFPETYQTITAFAEVVRSYIGVEYGNECCFAGIQFLEIHTESDKEIKESLDEHSKKANWETGELKNIAQHQLLKQLLDFELLERKAKGLADL
ncbi:MAG: PilZ domain-containing protein [Candidatus Firestonebacteria bacterium]